MLTKYTKLQNAMEGMACRWGVWVVKHVKCNKPLILESETCGTKTIDFRIVIT